MIMLKVYVIIKSMLFYASVFNTCYFDDYVEGLCYYQEYVYASVLLATLMIMLKVYANYAIIKSMLFFYASVLLATLMIMLKVYAILLCLCVTRYFDDYVEGFCKRLLCLCVSCYFDDLCQRGNIAHA